MISAAIIGEAEVIHKLGLRGNLAKDEMRKVVDLMALKTLSRAKMKLSDDVLHVRTGRLRRSITQEVTDNAGAITGVVGTNVEYARFQELGFSGTQNVRAHLRTIKGAFGKAIKGGPVTFTVAAHARKVDYPAHSFLQSSLRELEPEFKDNIERATHKAFSP